MSGRIEKAWQSYRERVVHPDAGDVQVLSLHQTFYAGAHAMFHAMISGVSDGPEEEITDADEQMMLDLNNELEAFTAMLAAKQGRVS